MKKIEPASPRHVWKLDSYGNVDEWSTESYDDVGHSGPTCVACGISPCWCCDDKERASACKPEGFKYVDADDWTELIAQLRHYDEWARQRGEREVMTRDELAVAKREAEGHKGAAKWAEFHRLAAEEKAACAEAEVAKLRAKVAELEAQLHDLQAEKGTAEL